MFILLVAAAMLEASANHSIQHTESEHPASNSLYIDSDVPESSVGGIPTCFLHPTNRTTIWLPPLSITSSTESTAVVISADQGPPLESMVSSPMSLRERANPITQTRTDTPPTPPQHAMPTVTTPSTIYKRFRQITDDEVEAMSIEELEDFSNKRHKSCRMDLEEAYDQFMRSWVAENPRDSTASGE
ncbi:hypothetical protein BDR26DRAFT_863799 [Obelidium mucronatum]|nr:hypothetical protein BDR26DRAFT_863799 [Obelidium mucronatum]